MLFPDVARSGPSPPHLPALVPLASLGSSQVRQGHHGHLCSSLRTWTSPGWAFLGTKCRGNAVFPKQDLVPSDGFVLISQGNNLLPELSLELGDPSRTTLSHTA